MGEIGLLVAIGVVAGGLSGMIGLGGGVIVVPALVYLCGYAQQLAQGTTLALMLPPIGVLAVWNYYERGLVDFRVAGIICIGFVVGSWFGSKGALAISPEVLRRVFGAVIILIGCKMATGR